MKIVFLNAWNGKIKEPLEAFLKEQSRDTDLFCFEEAYDEMRALARGVLADYVELEKGKYVSEDDSFAQAVYVKKTLPLLSSGTVMEHEDAVGLGLYVQVRSGNHDLYLCNFHGMSRPTEKIDDPGRLHQSQILIDFFKDKEGAKVIGGDFNLFPDTKSVAMFRDAGYRDLINEYGVETTRNQIAWSMYPENPHYHSDYIFLSPEVTLKNFSVPYREVSDHLPLIIEIE